MNDLKVRPGAGVKPGMFPQRHLTGQQETISTAEDNSSSPSFFSSVPSCCITSTSSAFIPIDQPREFSFDSPNSGNIFAICSLSLLWNPPSHLCRAFHWDTWDPGLPFANCSVDGNQGNAPQNIFGELSAPERPSERLTRAVSQFALINLCHWLYLVKCMTQMVLNNPVANCSHYLMSDNVCMQVLLLHTDPI